MPRLIAIRVSIPSYRDKVYPKPPCPSLVAHDSGVRPYLSPASSLAPFASSSLTTTSFHFLAALNSGVWPYSSLDLSSAPCATSSLTIVPFLSSPRQQCFYQYSVLIRNIEYWTFNININTICSILKDIEYWKNIYISLARIGCYILWPVRRTSKTFKSFGLVMR